MHDLLASMVLVFVLLAIFVIPLMPMKLFFSLFLPMFRRNHCPCVVSGELTDFMTIFLVDCQSFT